MNERVINSLELRDKYVAERLDELAPQLRSVPFVIFGAGAHTRRLFDLHPELMSTARAILDDDPARRGSRIGPVEVLHPGDMPSEGIELALISSDAHEEALAQRAQQWLADAALPGQAVVVRLYRFARVDFDHIEIVDSLGPYRGTQNLDERFTSLWDRTLKQAGVDDNAWRRPRFYNLCSLVRATEGLPGASIEAGCYRGQSSLLTCEIIKSLRPEYVGEDHYIVDSFEGLSEPTGPDGEFSVKRHAEGAFTETSVERVRRTLADFPRVSLHKGWIPDVLRSLPELVFRFVHLDVDLYEPTLAMLRFCYPRMPVGGVILIDDYGPFPNGSYPGCGEACRVFAGEIGVHLAPLSAGNAIFIKR